MTLENGCLWCVAMAKGERKTFPFIAFNWSSSTKQDPMDFVTGNVSFIGRVKKSKKKKFKQKFIKVGFKNKTNSATISHYYVNIQLHTHMYHKNVVHTLLYSAIGGTTPNKITQVCAASSICNILTQI